MNKEITVIVVDDNAEAIKKLCGDLSNFPDLRVLESFISPVKARNAIIREQPDILFLDVEMPEMSGIELLRSIQQELNPETKVVFYSAYNKYLLDALRASAFDYLLKPYAPDELSDILERYRSHVSKADDSIAQSLRNLLTQENIFAIPSAMGVMLVNIEQILLFQFSKEEDCWQLMHTDDHRLHNLRAQTNSKELLAINKMFYQISKDCIVNLKFISTIESKTMQCVFCYPHDKIKKIASQRCFKKIREALEIF